MVNYEKMTKEELVKVIERKQLRIVELECAVDSVKDLIASSSGVAGLHLNGDIADWDSLRSGGSFEEWLSAFDDAIDT